MAAMFQVGDPNRVTDDNNEIEDRDSDRTVRTTAQAKGQAMANRESRNEAIDAIVRKWIDDGREGEPGRIILDPDFNALRFDVESLRTAGRRGSKWQEALSEWNRIIDVAIKSFCDENGYSYVNAPSYDGMHSYEHEGREYIRVFKWAVLEGAGRAYAAA